MEGETPPGPGVRRPGLGPTSAHEHVDQAGPPESGEAGEVVVRLRDTGPGSALDELQERVDSLLSQGPRTLVVDLSDVMRLSSTTVAALLWIKRRCADRSVHAVLRKPSHRSVSILARIGLLDAGTREPVADWDRTRLILTAFPGRS